MCSRLNTKCWLRLCYNDRKKKYNYTALKHVTSKHETLNSSGLFFLAYFIVKLPANTFQYDQFLVLHLASEPSCFKLFFLQYSPANFQIIINNLAFWSCRCVKNLSIDILSYWLKWYYDSSSWLSIYSKIWQCRLLMSMKKKISMGINNFSCAFLKRKLYSNSRSSKKQRIFCEISP